MCVILIAPPKLRPDRATLEACHRANPHGAGLAWRADGTVHYRKSDDVAEIHRLAERAAGEVVIHFRIATVGGARPELRHPFLVTGRSGLAEGGTAKAVLFQNGTWTGWKDAIAKAVADGHRAPVGPMSDARAAAWLSHLYGPGYLAALEPSRWVFFTATETILHGHWHARDGLRFSNLNWCRGEYGAAGSGGTRPSAPRTGETTNLWGGESRDYWAHLRAACPK